MKLCREILMVHGAQVTGTGNLNVVCLPVFRKHKLTCALKKDADLSNAKKEAYIYIGKLRRGMNKESFNIIPDTDR